MNFFRRLKQKPPETQDALIINQLYKLLRNHGDDILRGTSKLSLTVPVLILLNRLFQKLTEGVNQSDFQVPQCDESEILFIYDFVQKVVSLKLLPGVAISNDPLINLSHFKLVEVLEVQKIPISYLKNLNLIRRQLRSLTCCRSVDTISNVISQFDSSEKLLQLPSLTELDLSCNKISNLNDDALKLLPVLKKLKLSYNNLQSADSEVLPMLSHLDLSFNSLTSVPIFSKNVLENLTHLNLRNNNLTSLKGLQEFSLLKVLDVSVNCLFEFTDLVHISYLEKLVTISLKDNPISFNARYRITVIRNLSPVRRRSQITFDGIKLTSDELGFLGKDVKPVPLLPPCFPEIQTSSLKTVNKKTRRVRNASIKEFSTCLPKRNGSSDSASSTSTKCNLSDDQLKLQMKNIYSSQNCSSNNSVRNNKSVELDDEQSSENESLKVECDTQPTNSDTILGDPNENSALQVVDDGIYGNVPMMGLSTIEMHLNSQNEPIDAPACSSFDHEFSDDAEYVSEFAYLVKSTSSKLPAAEIDSIEDFEYLFIYFHLSYLIEKCDKGVFRNRLDLNYLSKVDCVAESLTVKMSFDLLRADWQYRKYVFEQKDHMDAFIKYAHPFAVKNFQKKISDMIHCKCLKCGVVFLKKALNKSEKCDDCGSAMIVQVNTNETSQSECSSQNKEEVIPTVNLCRFHISKSLPCLHELEETSLLSLHRSFSYPKLTNEENSSSSINSMSCQTKDNLFSQKVSGIAELSTSSDKCAFESPKNQSKLSLNTLEQESLYLDEVFRCHHRLKLFLSINVYKHEDEEFVCQLRCKCVLHTKSEPFDCFFHVSSAAVYIFEVLNQESLSPEKSLKKVVSCDIKKVMLIAPCYNYQSFIIELPKPSVRLKFLTGDSLKTFKLLAAVEVEFSRNEVASSYSPVYHPRTAANIRLQVFGLEEDLLNKADRLYTQLLLYSTPQLLQTRKYHLRTYHKCFVAQEFLDWLCFHREVSNRKEALLLCNQLLHEGHIIHISKKSEFKDDADWYQFTLFTDESTNSMQSSKVSSDTLSYISCSSDSISHDVKIYLLARVILHEEDLLHQTVLCTLSHIFILTESHIWPLPRTFLPTAVSSDQFVTTACIKMTDIVSLELYDDSPCQLSIKFAIEENEERSWLIKSKSAIECEKLLVFIKTAWQELFAIELNCYNQPTYL